MNTEGSSSKGGSRTGRKLVALTNIKKKELCEYKIANPTKTNEQIRNEFGISKSTVGDILREKATNNLIQHHQFHSSRSANTVFNNNNN
ncbi:20194_t:CDS:2 [Entrophospora sp. SA101]|nr:20194_t:CDS:2 [Entrophospora sp. SA101]